MSLHYYWIGVDVGSTTVKIAVVDPETKNLLFSLYRRHYAEPAKTLLSMLTEAHERFPDIPFKVAVCGSGGIPIAEKLGAFFIQEVVANSIAVRTFYKNAGTAIEIGGQDAKIIFFGYNPSTGQLIAEDMRMNGSCAGGTGAFIDQIAELLNIKPEDFGRLAEKGKYVHEISGRCGVFAKTDIQPLLNKGVRIEDIALSTFHAIAKQTIGGLAQGKKISPPVIFEGGPFNFYPSLRRVFSGRLCLKEEEIIIPEEPEVFIAQGAALSIGVMFADHTSGYKQESSLKALKDSLKFKDFSKDSVKLRFFDSPEEEKEFLKRHNQSTPAEREISSCSELKVFLGIDAGSTTTKLVLLDEEGCVVDSFYSGNFGEPIKIIRDALLEIEEKYRNRGIKLNILGAGTTGYGELLFARAFNADYHNVETIAHAEAARKYSPDVNFILDIGGQDMKAITLKQGIVTGIVLNEACSAGCGSFIETYAKSLGIKADQISELAFRAENPSRLGSRCTVFMNSSIVTEQKNGKTVEDILAGISRSIIENVFTKVIRLTNPDLLGDKIVVQGGTFKNNAVLRAFEQYIGREVIRPPYPELMGAIGIALLTMQYMQQNCNGNNKSRFIGFEELKNLDYEKKPELICPFCSNSCKRTLILFSNGTRYITGNRCERGEIMGEPSDPEVKEKIRRKELSRREVADLVKIQNRLILSDYNRRGNVSRPHRGTIGIPRVLELWASLPFWKTLFSAAGFRVIVSPRSTYEIFENSLPSITSDTICFPAKIVHGHVKELVKKRVDRIFMPMMIRIPKENRTAGGTHTCSIVQGYPLVVAKTDAPDNINGITLDTPCFHWYNSKLKKRQTIDFLVNTLGVSLKEAQRAFSEADRALSLYRKTVVFEGKKVIDSLKGKEDFAVVFACRPYHLDELVNHNLSTYFTALGIPVLTLESLPGIHRQDLSKVRLETTIPYHVRMLGGALYTAKQPNLEMVQIVSFGCGHDAVLTDEIARILRETAGKELLVLKLDESEISGPLNIRIKSFIETVKRKRQLRLKAGEKSSYRELGETFSTKFSKKDRERKTILAPNLSPSFSKISAAVTRKLGYKVLQIPIADQMAIELGKKYVHNDICYPAQINIGEALAALERGLVHPDSVALGLAKNCEDCRAGQYAALARKALDDAGYTQIPIVTTGTDTKNMHPGFKLGLKFQLNMVWGLCFIDGLETMRRTLRPYELNQGDVDRTFNCVLDDVCEALTVSTKEAMQAFRGGVHEFNRIPVDRRIKKPKIGIVGEILLNYHPSSNLFLERYLESHGMEVVIPPMLDFFRRSYLIEMDKARRKLVPNPFLTGITASLANRIIGMIKTKVDRALQEFRLDIRRASIDKLIENIRGFIDISYIVGEGWLLPAEIIQMIKEGINHFIIVQPFGCLPNHITGRGVLKAIKDMYPHAQILCLDYDPDTSLANIENRLQMLIINAREYYRTTDTRRQLLNKSA